MNTKTIIAQQNTSNVERLRSHADITARYNLDCQQYNELRKTDNGNDQEHLLMLYTEIKVLGWILGKNDQTVVRDTNA